MLAAYLLGLIMGFVLCAAAQTNSDKRAVESKTIRLCGKIFRLHEIRGDDYE